MLNSQVLGSSLPVICEDWLKEFSEETERRVEGLWRKAIEDRPNLFNGTLVSFLSKDTKRIGCFTSEYKYFLAQRRDSSLFQALKIQPLAVTGILKCRDGVVFGRRSTEVEMDVGLLESVPSGGLDAEAISDGKVHVKEHLLKELAEEIGISAGEVAQISDPFLLIEDRKNHVFDLCILLETYLGRDQVLARLSSTSAKEYSSLAIVDPQRVKDFIDQSFDHVAPLTSHLFQTILEGKSQPLANVRKKIFCDK